MRGLKRRAHLPLEPTNSRTYSPARRENRDVGRKDHWLPERGMKGSQEVVAALAGGVEHTGDDGVGLSAPVGAEAACHLTMHHGVTQGLLGGVVRRGHGRIIEEDE